MTSLLPGQSQKVSRKSVSGHRGNDLAVHGTILLRRFFRRYLILCHDLGPACCGEFLRRKDIADDRLCERYGVDHAQEQQGQQHVSSNSCHIDPL